MLDVLPHPLVGIELRRVRWEVEELETSLGRGDKLLGLAGLVGGMSVDDQVDRTLHVVEKLLQVLDEAGGIHPAGETEVQLAFGPTFRRSGGPSARISRRPILDPVGAERHLQQAEDLALKRVGLGRRDGQKLAGVERGSSSSMTRAAVGAVHARSS